MTPGNLAELLLTSAAERPGSTAVVDGSRRLTYAEWEVWSAAVRDSLVEAGVQPRDRVLLLAPKSLEAAVAILGILRAGGVYVPLDPESPAARLAKAIRRAETRWIVAAGNVTPVLEELSGPASLSVLRISEAPMVSPGGKRPAGADRMLSPDDPAYLLFTSGSTGEPKGVVIHHRNVLAFLDWAVPYFEIGPLDRISAHPPLHFDLSVFDLFGSLAAGAELHLVSPQLNLLPHKLAEWIESSRLTQWFSVPGVLTLLARFGLVRADRFPELKRVLWCGEVLPTPTLIQWMSALPRIRYTNLYGPTETTIASSYHAVLEIPSDPRDPIPIGRPCPGEELMVLDDAMRGVAVGEVGDLWIGGVGVSPGYWRDPERTADVFVPDPRGIAGRIYRTGDLGSVDPDGRFRFHGRADSQVKSRGYRIELGEVEAALAAIDGLREVAVVAVPTGGFEGVAICCAYVPEVRGDPSPSALRTRLSSALPAYMIPRRWKELDRLPSNANGKADRPRLREMFLAGEAGGPG